MEIVQMALSEEPLGCIKFYGISLVSGFGESEDSKLLCLVFERATEGTIEAYIRNNALQMTWADLVALFSTVGEALDRGLHRKKIIHRYEILPTKF